MPQVMCVFNSITSANTWSAGKVYQFQNNSTIRPVNSWSIGRVSSVSQPQIGAWYK